MKIAIITILIICIGKIKWANTYEKGLLKISLYLSIFNVVYEIIHGYVIYGLNTELLKTSVYNIIPILATLLISYYCKKEYTKLH